MTATNYCVKSRCVGEHDYRKKQEHKLVVLKNNIFSF